MGAELDAWQIKARDPNFGSQALSLAGPPAIILDIELGDRFIIGHQRFVSLEEHLTWK